jgi:hypothetical protein
VKPRQPIARRGAEAKRLIGMDVFDLGVMGIECEETERSLTDER